MLNHIRKFGHNTFNSLKIRNYRLYFFGQGISVCGTWMQRIGQSWLVLKLTESGTAVGLVVAFQYLPVLIIGPFGGVIADRFSKRKILLITQFISGLLALILGVLVATNNVELWMVYALAAALGVIDAVDGPARHTFVHEMVGSDRIKNAVTLNSIEVNMAKVIGPAIAGIIIASIGIASCFLINASTFLAVLICLLFIREDELHKMETIKDIKGQFIKGIQYIGQNHLVRNLLIMMAIVGTFSYEFQVSLPLLAKFTFHGDAKSYSFLMSAMVVGSVLGGLITASRKVGQPIRLAWSAIAFGMAILAVSISPNMATAVIALVVVGVFSISFTAMGNSTIQLSSIPAMRGRVMALWTVAFLGTTLVGGPVIGWVGEYVDPRGGLVVGGLAAICAGIFGMITLRNHNQLSN